MTTNDGYNDAWNTAGWTSQNMAYPPPSSTTMDLPTDIPLVTISGHFRDGDGGRANGWFDIDNGNTVLRHATTKEVITPIKIRVEIKDGVFSVTVPATDGSTITSDALWGYHIRVSLRGRPFQELTGVALPAADPNVDVYDLFNGMNLDGGTPNSPNTALVDGGTP